MIREYALARGYEIARTYADDGKSGLPLQRRDALNQLIHDVVTGNADIEAVLVYHVSRWRRFGPTLEITHAKGSPSHGELPPVAPCPRCTPPVRADCPPRLIELFAIHTSHTSESAIHAP